MAFLYSCIPCKGPCRRSTATRSSDQVLRSPQGPGDARCVGMHVQRARLPTCRAVGAPREDKEGNILTRAGWSGAQSGARAARTHGAPGAHARRGASAGVTQSRSAGSWARRDLRTIAERLCIRCVTQHSSRRWLTGLHQSVRAHHDIALFLKAGWKDLESQTSLWAVRMHIMLRACAMYTAPQVSQAQHCTHRRQIT